MLIDEAIKEYIFNIDVQEGKAKKTVTSYRRDLNIYNNFLKKNKLSDIKNINDEVISKFVSSISKIYAPASCSRIKTSVRNFHHYLSFKYDIKDPSFIIEVSHSQKRLPIYCTNEEIEKIMNLFADTPEDIFNHAILETIYGLGLRVSECCNLTTSQINLNEGFAKILGKGGKERLIPIPKVTRDCMNEYFTNIRPLWLKKSSNLFFINKNSKKYIQNMYNY